MNRFRPFASQPGARHMSTLAQRGLPQYKVEGEVARLAESADVYARKAAEYREQLG